MPYNLWDLASLPSTTKKSKDQTINPTITINSAFALERLKSDLSTSELAAKGSMLRSQASRRYIPSTLGVDPAQPMATVDQMLMESAPDFQKLLEAEPDLAAGEAGGTVERGGQRVRWINRWKQETRSISGHVREPMQSASQREKGRRGDVTSQVR